MKTLLCITIGQAPRNDMLESMKPYLNNFNIIQRGALDGLTKENILKNYSPEEGDYILESRLKSGAYVNFSEEKIIDKIQEIIYKEEDSVDFILMLCTGVFDYEFKTKKSIIFPQKLIDPVVRELVGNKKLVVLSPAEVQLPQSRKKWGDIVKNSEFTFVSPYAKKDEEFENAAEFINNENADVVFMDCMGYSLEMQKYFREKTKASVILGNALIGKLISELA